MTTLTPEQLAEGRRLIAAANGLPGYGYVRNSLSALIAAAEELDALRGKINELHRRCQGAESAVRENVEACKAAGVSFGRSLANAAARMYQAERDALKAEIASVILEVGEPEPGQSLGNHVRGALLNAARVAATDAANAMDGGWVWSAPTKRWHYFYPDMGTSACRRVYAEESATRRWDPSVNDPGAPACLRCRRATTINANPAVAP